MKMGARMKFHLALGVIVWVMIAVWLVRLSMGLVHLSKDQNPVMLVCGSAGGLVGRHFVSRHAKKIVAQRKDTRTIP
jgi:hypothetical protein